MIPQQFIEEVQQKTDIVDLISSYIPLRRAGRNFKALCPFHNEKTSSFFVSPQRQIFHCFGCGEGGGPLQFIMLYDKTSFVEAVEELAQKIGMRIPYQEVSAKDKLRTLLYDVVHQTAQFFHQNLISSKEAQPARDYLAQRGIDKEAIDVFKIGYAASNSSLLRYMRSRSVTLDMLEKVSLITEKPQGGWRDLFWQRIIFPICDVRHRPVGFGARFIEGLSRRSSVKGDIPKYINSGENILYRKRECLFGLNFSKDEIIKKDSVIVTEGYLDMITPYQAGIKNIVASLGTALTLEQIRLIKRYTHNIILVFDADKAGQNATLRAVDILLENGLNVTILSMPEGLDLDLALRQKGVDFVTSLIEKRNDFFDYKMSILRRLYDIDSIDGKVKIARQMLSTIGKLTSELEQYEYVKKLSVALKVRETLLMAEFGKVKTHKPVSLRSPGQDIRASVPITEQLIIKAIFANNRLLTMIKGRINEEDFSHPLSRKTFSLLLDKSSAGNFSGRQFISSIEDKEISGFVSRVLMEDAGSIDKSILKSCIIKLRRNHLKMLLDSLKAQIRTAEKDKDEIRVKNLMIQFRKINSEVRNG